MTRERALSTAVSFALIIAITVSVTAGLIVGVDTLVTDKRHQAAQEQLDVVAERLAAALSAADRLADTDAGPNTLAVTQRLPRRVAGSQYRIVIIDPATAPTNQYVIRLEAVDFDLTTETPLRLEHVDDLRETTLNGGTVRVAYVSGNELEVQNGAS